MRLGIFGGSFDPVHYGHLLLAECCREQCALDEVWFVPAAQSPHKLDQQPTSADDRVAMLELSVGGRESFRVSRLELERGGVSYTVDTLRTIHDQQPSAELFVILGGDNLRDLRTWREPQTICELAVPLVAQRPGSPSLDDSVLAELVSAERLAAIRTFRVTMPQIELSSSDLRERVAAGHSIRYRTPRAVERYIESHGLYR